MTKRVLWICGICGIAILIYFTSRTTEISQKESTMRLTIFKSDNGWGYKIDKNNKMVIYQPYIPVIQGKQPFPTSQSARKIGQKVIGKILLNQMPVVTAKDLITEGITINSTF